MALVICCVPITEAIRLRISFKFAIFTKKVVLSVLYKSPQSYYFFGIFIGFFVKIYTACAGYMTVQIVYSFCLL